MAPEPDIHLMILIVLKYYLSRLFAVHNNGLSKAIYIALIALITLSPHV